MLRLRSAQETAAATKLLLLLEFSPTTFRRSSRQQNKWQENENFFAKPVTFYLSQDT